MNNNQISYKGVTVEGLLDYLSDKTLSKNCKVLYRWGNRWYEGVLYHEPSIFIKRTKIPASYSVDMLNGVIRSLEPRDVQIIGHPVLIGDVLKKMSNLDILHAIWKCEVQYGAELYSLWENCGFNKSLNEIFSGEVIHWELRQGDSGGEELFSNIKVQESDEFPKFKDHDTQVLFEFLVDTFYEQLMGFKK